MKKVRKSTDNTNVCCKRKPNKSQGSRGNLGIAFNNESIILVKLKNCKSNAKLEKDHWRRICKGQVGVCTNVTKVH